MNFKTKFKIIKEIIKNCGVNSLFNLGLSYFTMKLTPNRVYTKPLFIQIEPTLKCNLKCKMCYGTYKRRDCKDLTLDKFKKIIDKFPSSVTIHLQGLGEPFLHQDIFEMIKYTKSKKLKASITTNGTIITDSIIGKILESGLDYLEISIDGATTKTYESIRTGANFEKFKKNIKNLTNRIKNKTELKAIVVIMKENYKELPDIIKLINELGIQSVFLIRVQHWKKDQSLLNFKEEELDKEIDIYIDKAKKIADEFGINFDSSISPKSFMGCKRPWLSTYITIDGYVTPCCRVTNPEIFNFGNIL